MNIFNQVNQVDNRYLNDPLNEDRTTELASTGLFGLPSGVGNVDGLCGNIGPQFMCSTRDDGVQPSWVDHMVRFGVARHQTTGASAPDQSQQGSDFLSHETRALVLRNPVKGSQEDKTGRILLNLAIQVYGFVKCKDRSVFQIIASVDAILMALGLDSAIYDWVAKELWSLATGLEVRPESLEDFGEAMGKDVMKYISTNLTNIVEKIIKFCSAALIAPSLMSSRLHYLNNIGRALHKTRLASFTSASLTVDGVVAMLAHCISRGIEYLINWSFPDDVNTLLRESVSLRESVEASLAIMDRETRDEMLMVLEAMQMRLTNKHMSVRGDKFTIAQALLKELDMVTKITSRVRSHAIHSMRVPAPLSVMLVGEPAIGKSELTKIVTYIVASVKRPGRDSMPYQQHEICYAPMSKYWNRLSNDTKVVIFDDVNALVKNGETSQCVAANWAEQLIQLVNNQGFMPELAEAEKKGTVQPHLDAVISTANAENRYGNAPGMANVDAVFRRYDMIDVVLKDKYRGPDGQIDFTLVAADGRDIYTVNPWKLSYKKYNLKLARRATQRSTKRGIDDDLWEFVTFTYRGVERTSEDITLDMLRELFKQQSHLQDSNGASISAMDKCTRKLLFPGVFEDAPTVTPQSMQFAGFFPGNNDWFLYQCYNVAFYSTFWVKTIALFVMPLISPAWVVYNGICWGRTGWFSSMVGSQTVSERCKYSLITFALHYQLLLFCWAFVAARRANPIVSFLARAFRVDLRAVFFSVMLGDRVNGFRMLTSDHLNFTRSHLRMQYTTMLRQLSSKEKRAAMQRTFVRGVFAGMTIGMLWKCVQIYLEGRRISKIGCEFNKRMGPNPIADPQTTIDGSGKITVVPDPKLNVVPRQVSFKGSYATMSKDRLRRADATQTVQDSRNLAARCVHRITIIPCVGGQLNTTQRSVFKSDMYVFGYDQYASGTYMVTVAHAFARDYSHFSVRVHDPSRVTKEHIIRKADIAFAPRMSVNSVEHDVDMCMFELPASVTGDLPTIKKLVFDNTLRAGETLTRLIPTSSIEDGVHTVDLVSGEYMALQSHVYSPDSPAASLLPNPISYWITGSGNDGLCGSLVMSGGVVVGMHTGSHAINEMVTACPINPVLMAAMKAQLSNKTLGSVGNYRLDNYVIRAPYLEEYSKTDLVIDPNVTVRVPGALEPALTDSFYNFVGTLHKNGMVDSVKAKTSIQISSHVDFLMDYLPDVPHLLNAYAIPSLSYKMHDTIGAFIAKSSISRPVDTYLLALAKEKVGSALYGACCDIVSDVPALAEMGTLNIQGGLDGKGLNMGGKVPINTSAGVAFPGVKSDYVANVYSPEHDEHFICFFEENEISMEIRDSVYDIIDRRKAGEVGLILNYICPKDEVLPVKADGRTKPMRHINKMDFAHIVVMRMYFQPILILLGYDPLACGHSVGLDPTAYYLEVIKSLVNGNVDVPLYRHQVEASAFVATDYSGFDLSLSGEVISAVMDIFINLSHLLNYTDEDRLVMASIAYDICNPCVVMLGTIVKLAGVNTSGNPLTTMINCVANMLINCQIHAMIKYDVACGKYMEDYARDYSGLTVKDMEFSLRSIVTYGDDVVVRVPKGSDITQPATIYYGKQLGYVITGSDKGDTVTTYAQDFGFLKRKFNLYVQPTTNEVVLCLAPLAMDSIFKPFVWGDFKKLDINDHYAGLIKSALHELVQHGSVVYEKHVPKLWAFVEAFVVETKPRKKAPLIIRSHIRSRFKGPFPSWEESIMEKYGRSMLRTNSELKLSELELVEL